MAIEEADMRNHTIYTSIARDWYLGGGSPPCRSREAQSATTVAPLFEGFGQCPPVYHSVTQHLTPFWTAPRSCPGCHEMFPTLPSDPDDLGRGAQGAVYQRECRYFPCSNLDTCRLNHFSLATDLMSCQCLCHKW